MKKWKWSRTAASEWACILSVILVLIFGLLPYLGIQSSQTNQSSNESVHHTAVGWPFYLSLVTALLCVGLFYLARRSIRPKADDPSPQSLEKTWCEKMAEEDAKRTTERIAILSVEPQPHYGESEPYIDFRITLINATVFRIESSKIEGQTYYGRTPLMQPPKLFDVKLTDNHSSLYHGEKTTLVVQQPLSSLTIDNLAGARGIVKLDFNRVTITFTVRDGIPGAPESFKWPIGDLIVANRD